MNASSSFEKIQICLMIKNKKKDLVYKKIRSVLLIKTKSFGSKTSDLFWEL